MTKTLQLFFIMLTFISINTVYGQAPGTLDESFGIAGKVTFDFRKTDMLKSILIQPDGKILAFGNTKETNGGNDFVVVRYNSNGTLDPSFGSSGVRAINLGSDEEEFLEM